MSASLGSLMLTAMMASADPNVTHYQLQKDCQKLAAETFNRETANDEDRVDYRAHYNARLNKCFYAETYISRTPVGINKWVYLSHLQENRIYGCRKPIAASRPAARALPAATPPRRRAA